MLLKDIDFLKKIDDNFSWKYLAMGIIYTFKDQKNRAIEECNKVLVCKDKKETIFLAYMLLGFLYELDCQFKKPAEGFLIKQALIAYKKALMINPESVKAHLNLGILYLKMENLNKAIDEFKIVNKLDYKYGKKHFHFKKIKNKNKYKNMKEYIQAVKMNTLSGRHNYILGLACLIKGNKNLAQRHFDKAREFGYESF
jgi:tetratricopeptide (TPR) repeat protein